MRRRIIGSIASYANSLVCLYLLQDHLYALLVDIKVHRDRIVKFEMGQRGASLSTQNSTLCKKQAVLDALIDLVNAKRMFVWNSVMQNPEQHALFDSARTELIRHAAAAKVSSAPSKRNLIPNF